MQASSIELKAKKSHYGLDGTGRDSYIVFNNGGNYRGYVPEGVGKFERGAFHTPRGKRINSNYVPISGKPRHYIGDGSGRDCYIISNEGGWTAGNGRNHNFLKTLRLPIQRVQIPEGDIYSKSQNNLRVKPERVSQRQRELDRRLSSHRNYQDPYKHMRTTFRSSLRAI